MKRDMETIRALLLQVEEKTYLNLPVPVGLFDLESYTPDEVIYHLIIMEELGLIKGEKIIGPLSGEIDQYGPVGPEGIVGFSVERLTAKGHDFLDAARNETIWKKAKTTLAEKGATVSLAVLQTLLTALLKNELGLS